MSSQPRAVPSTPPAEVEPSAALATVPFDVSDPASTEALGRRLTALVVGSSLDAVIVEEDLRNLVLGHVVARELGVRLIYAFDDGGLLQASSSITPSSAVALVSGETPEDSSVRAATSLLERHGARLAAVLAPDPSDSGDDSSGTSADEAG